MNKIKTQIIKYFLDNEIYDKEDAISIVEPSDIFITLKIDDAKMVFIIDENEELILVEDW